MPNRWAVANGDWSNTATWNGGTLPTSADDIFANNFTVNVNQNIDVISLRSTSISGVNAGGTFNFNTANITANVSGQIIAGATTLISVSATTGTITINAPTATITGLTTGSTNVISHSGSCALTITCTRIQGGTTANRTECIFKSSAGTLTINGDVAGGNNTGANNSQGIYNQAGGAIVNVNGNIINGTGTGTLTNAILQNGGILNIVGNVSAVSGAGSSLNTINTTINITGNVTGGTSQVAIVIPSTSILNITGNVTGGSISTAMNSGGNTTIIGVINGGTANGVAGATITGGTFNHIGTAQASAFASAIVGNAPTTSNITCTGPFLRNGFIVAFAGQTLRINSAYNPYFEFRKSDNTNVTYVDQSTLNFPAINNVRSGTTYASGLYTGTLAVPLPAQVLAGIPTDATTGTLLMTPQQFWDYLISSGFAVGSIGERLQNASTVATTGSQIASYTL